MKILERTQRVAAGRKETSNGREKKDKNRGKLRGRMECGDIRDVESGS